MGFKEVMEDLDNGELAMEELYQINNRVVDRIKRQRRAENFAAIGKLHVGQEVTITGTFSGHNSWLTGVLGEVTEIRQTKIKVRIRAATASNPHAFAVYTMAASAVTPYEADPVEKKVVPLKKKAAVKKKAVKR
jgi:preprotein translocase subunit YajC